MRHLLLIPVIAFSLTSLAQVPTSNLIDQGWILILERQGHQYWLQDVDHEWEEARLMCESLGAYLYWPNSLEEHIDVWNSVTQGSNDGIHFWTAVHQNFNTVECDDPGGWAGPNGEPQTFFHWRSGEPSNGSNGESVVQFEWGTDGAEWNDAPGQPCDGETTCSCAVARVIMERQVPEECNCLEGTVWDENLAGCAPLITAETACGEGTQWDAVSQKCVIANLSDTDFDGCVSMTDLLDLLSVFGTCNEIPWSCGDPLEYQGYDYETVQIGEQCWFAENLRSENYENGDLIPAGLSGEEWSSTTSGAMALYGEGSSSCNTDSPDGDACDPNWSLAEYGRLYNWFAVNDARGLCPSGWHVPADGEWTVMIDELGGEFMAGGIMKTTEGWYNGGNGNNSSGFSGLPGGLRGGFLFDTAGRDGLWWSSSPNGDLAWYQVLSYHGEDIHRTGSNRQNGMSVRCIQDSE